MKWIPQRLHSVQSPSETLGHISHVSLHEAGSDEDKVESQLGDPSNVQFQSGYYQERDYLFPPNILFLE